MSNNILGSRFKIKYQKAGLHMGPSVAFSVYGYLKKGAVVDIIEDASAYYYKVRLDSGLEGYLYKPAGEVTSLPLTRLSDEEMKALSVYMPRSETTSMNGAAMSDVPTMGAGSRQTPNRRTAVRTITSNGRTPATKGGETVAPGARLSPTTMNIEISSAEIAVFDAPGIIGRQVAKLRRGERVALVSQDGFFYQIQLANGTTGFIPRYSADAK